MKYILVDEWGHKTIFDGMRAFERANDRPPWQIVLFMLLGSIGSCGFLSAAPDGLVWAIVCVIAWCALALLYHYAGLRTAWNGHLAVAIVVFFPFIPCFAMAPVAAAFDGPVSTFTELARLIGWAGGLASAFSIPIAIATLVLFSNSSDGDA